MEHVHIGEMLPVVETIECSLADAEVSDCLEEEVRVALRDLKYKSEQWRPFEDLHTLMLRINDRFDHVAKLHCGADRHVCGRRSREYRIC